MHCYSVTLEMLGREGTSVGEPYRIRVTEYYETSGTYHQDYLCG